MKPRTKRILGISLAAVVVVIVAGAVGVSSWFQRFLRSPEFQNLVAAKTGQALQSEAALSPLRWNGASVFSDSFQASGLSGGVLNALKADQVRAEVNWRAAFQGAWRVEEINVVNLEGSFRPGTPAGAATPAPARAPGPQVPSWLPQRFELGQLNVARARLSFGGVQGDDSVGLRDTALTVKPDGAGWTIDGRGGDLQVPRLPELTVSDFRTRLQGGTFFVTEARLRLGETGQIEASGEFAKDSRLQLEWSKVDVSAFLDAAWKNRLSGTVEGSAVLTWPVEGMAAGQASGKFLLTDGLLQNLAVLEQIASFTGAPQFRRMPVQELSGTFQWAAGAWIFQNLVLESKGLLRVEGKGSIGSAGEVAGVLRVGVAPQTLQWLPGSRERVFTVAENGYLWTDVRIGGTLDQVREDLSARLARAMGEEIMDQGTTIIETLPGAAKDGAKGVLDVLSPLLR